MLPDTEKRRLYKAGAYFMPVPAVCHAAWSGQNWIDFIDKHGRWVCI